MILNKSYYLKLAKNSQIISGESGHEPLSSAELAEMTTLLQPKLNDNTLLRGEKEEVIKKTMVYPDAKGNLIPSNVVGKPQKIVVTGVKEDGTAAEGFINWAEIDYGNNRLRVFVRSDDYVKKESDDAASAADLVNSSKLEL